MSKNDGRGVGHLKRFWKDGFSVAGAIQETCSSEMLGGQGADSLRGVAFWSVSTMILRDRCSTLYNLASLFRGKRSTLDRLNRKSQNTVSSPLDFSF